jgi:hypothetical protein
LGFCVHANTAAPTAFLVDVGVFGRKLVSSFAVSLSTLLSPSLFNHVALDWGMKLGRRHDLLQRKPPFKPILNGPSCNSDFLGYLCRPNFGAIDVDHKRPMSGFLLLLPRGPLEVIRAVRPVIVNTINCMTGRWLLTYISNEKPEVMPSVTDSYPPPSVPTEMGSIGLVATSNHVAPSVVKWVAFLDHSMTLNDNTVIVKEAC